MIKPTKPHSFLSPPSTLKIPFYWIAKTKKTSKIFSRRQKRRHLNLDVSRMMLGNFAFFFFFFEASPDIMLHRLEMETDVSKYILHIPNVLLYPWIKIILYVKMKISIIMGILILLFIGYIRDISMDILKKNINKSKID